LVDSGPIRRRRSKPLPADLRKRDAELTKFGKSHEFHTYAGAAKAFVDSGSRNYRGAVVAESEGASRAIFGAMKAGHG